MFENEEHWAVNEKALPVSLQLLTKCVLLSKLTVFGLIFHNCRKKEPR